jgi:hypothetical protein
MGRFLAQAAVVLGFIYAVLHFTGHAVTIAGHVIR